MISDEGQMDAAQVMRRAAETNQRAADNLAETVARLERLFDPAYGGAAAQLMMALEKATEASTHDGAELVLGAIKASVGGQSDDRKFSPKSPQPATNAGRLQRAVQEFIAELECACKTGVVVLNPVEGGSPINRRLQELKREASERALEPAPPQYARYVGAVVMPAATVYIEDQMGRELTLEASKAYAFPTTDLATIAAKHAFKAHVRNGKLDLTKIPEGVIAGWKMPACIRYCGKVTGESTKTFSEAYCFNRKDVALDAARVELKSRKPEVAAYPAVITCVHSANEPRGFLLRYWVEGDTYMYAANHDFTAASPSRNSAALYPDPLYPLEVLRRSFLLQGVAAEIVADYEGYKL